MSGETSWMKAKIVRKPAVKIKTGEETMAKVIMVGHDVQCWKESACGWVYAVF